MIPNITHVKLSLLEASKVITKTGKFPFAKLQYLLITKQKGDSDDTSHYLKILLLYKKHKPKYQITFRRKEIRKNITSDIITIFNQNIRNFI
jgi:hypothetical protein